MQAKDLTQADIGKYITLRAKIVDLEDFENLGVLAHFEGGIKDYIHPDITIKPFDPYSPVENADYLIGDVFKNIGTHPAEWSIAAIQGNACIMRYLTGHVSADYPLNPDLWEFVRKGTTK